METPSPAIDQLEHLPGHIRDTLAKVRQELIAFYGDQLKRIILFGSYARGDFHEDSDLDIMPVVSGTSVLDLKKEGLFQLAYRHFEQDRIRVSFVPSLMSQFVKAETFLLMFVHKDGIDL